MSSYVESYGTISWYTNTFGLNHLEGEKGGHRVENVEEKEEEGAENRKQWQAATRV